MFAKYILIFVFISLQNHIIWTSDSCATRRTCEDCIRDSSVCVWCASNDFKGAIRCQSQNTTLNDWCPTPVEDPTNFINASADQQFSSDNNHVVQIRPQRYKLKLRPGKPQDFTFSFQAAKDFPVDLYFLLDASKTMKSITSGIAKESENIYMAIRNMTSNVHLGLGTFVDKRLLPFVSTFDSKKTYSFRHRLKLVDDFMSFKHLISSTPPGKNRDIQEGGLDALAQVMTCKETIGWRNESRKIIIFLTDGPYHAAGDGKSAGLFTPYDGACYTKNNTYTKEQEMDYPSVGMINKLATERDIIIIFFVECKVDGVYRELSGLVSGSRITSYSSKKIIKSDAIVGILKDIYEEISKKIKLKVNVKSARKKNVQISVKPDCTKDDSSSDCRVDIGKEQQLVGTVKVLEYLEDNVTIDLAVEGIGEKITLDIDIIKQCGCENNTEEHSAYCHGERRVCGLCSCGSTRYGEKCFCVKRQNNKFNDNSTCIAEGSTDICNGHGSCICGTCKCRERYTGKFCECNMDSCPRSSSGVLCNGHGTCKCGKCDCGPDWTGDACDCFKSDTDCGGGDGSICNNRGQCDCGACKCDPLATWDARGHQDKNCKVLDCADCHKVQCRKLEECAKCQRSKGDDCMICDERIKTKVFETMPDEYLNGSLSQSWNKCENTKVEVGCYTTFVYRYSDTDYSLELIVAQQKDCTENYFKFGIICLVMLLLVGAGTLVAWKLLTDARDRLEYLRFQQQHEQDASKPSTNVLYQSPSTTVTNPRFRKPSVDMR